MTDQRLGQMHPDTGQVRVQRVTSFTNDGLHGWLKKDLADIVSRLPAPDGAGPGRTTRNRTGPPESGDGRA